MDSRLDNNWRIRTSKPIPSPCHRGSRVSRDKCRKISTADYSIEGYEDASNDTQQRKPNSKFGIFRSFHPFTYLWGFNDILDRYSQNYDQSHLNGQRVNKMFIHPRRTPAR